MSRIKLQRALLILVIVSVSILVLLCGCEHKKGMGPGNEPPGVKISGGPPSGGTDYYAVLLRWFGWDQDGFVDHFLYAIDDTTQWTETRFFEGSFLFRCDSTRTGGEFGRWHTFYIKAVDDDGLESLPDFLTFDSRTIAPKATIRSPKCDELRSPCLGAIPLGTFIRIVWDGEDPDSRDLKQKPVAYTWRMFNTSLLNPTFGVEDDSLLLNIPEGQIDTTSRWSAPTPQTSIQLTNLTPGIFWQFGVRAIDEAGAVEPGLRKNRNVIFFKTSATFGSPILNMYEGYTSHIFPVDGQIWRKEAGSRGSISFTWRGDASSYGGTIASYIYGLDIEDLTDPEQWEGDWSGEVTGANIHFSSPGTHYLYVKVKDLADTEQLAIVELNIVDFEFDRKVLYVDDYYDIMPSDGVHDSFRDAILDCARAVADSVYIFNCCPAGPNNDPPELPDLVLYPRLSEISRYKLVIWDVDATRNSFKSGMLLALRNNVLDAYLRGGGSLWVFGVCPIRGSCPSPGTYNYGAPPPYGSFADDFLKISATVDLVPRLQYSNRADGFRGAFPNRALSDKIPCLDSLDYSKGGVSVTYGLAMVEAVASAMQDPDRAMRPDTVYFYKSNYPSSRFNNRACAFRYEDVYTGSKVMYMGFPIQFLFESKGDSLVCFVIDWVFGGGSP